ncbi:hypothetical protein DSTSK_04940 [Desulforhabdus sp. TSK]|nr:hypothetical protein DSTSK_04940 [Desulforhabdus sp. TSK]
MALPCETFHMKKGWHLQRLILTHSTMNVKSTGKDILNERTQGGLCTL